ncbi:MAG: caspase family protein [Microcoleaceae cyanobacterium]
MNREALVVGINHYPFLKDFFGQPRHLMKPAADAEAIAQLLETYGHFQVRRFPGVSIEDSWQVDPHPKTKNCEITALKEAISQLFNPPNNIPDTALLFFVGNSLLDEQGGVQEGFLAASDTNPQKAKWGISLHWLSQILEKSPVRQQIVWLDCHHIGKSINFLQTDITHLESTNNERCFIFVSQEIAVEKTYINSEHSFLTNCLLEALEPENHPNGWVTNYSLIDYLNQKLSISILRPVFHNSGNEIILTGEKENIENTDMTAGVCPYKGLAAFEFNDKEPKYFYGRTALINILLEKIRSRNFLAVVGASGIGKSSLVKAGLLYQLKLGQRLSGSNTWPILIIRPGEYPLKSLAAVFTDYQLQTLLTSTTPVATTPQETVTFDSITTTSSTSQQNKQKRRLSPKSSIPNPLPLATSEPKTQARKKRASSAARKPTIASPTNTKITIPSSLNNGDISEDRQRQKPRDGNEQIPNLHQQHPETSGLQNLNCTSNNGKSSTAKNERIIYSPIEIEELINQGATGFKQVLENIQAPRIVMVVDRFEEVFTLALDKIERQQFFECLMGAIDKSYQDNSNATRFLLIITMGSEFIGKCFEQEYAGLSKQIQSHLVTVTPMTRLELKQAIVEPAKQVGIEIQPELVEQMILDVENHGNLPLLQYTLTELWRQRRVDQFTLTQYINLGGVKSCLEKQAYAIYHSLNARERQVAKRIFLKLVQIPEDTEATQKPALKTDLITPQQSLAVVSKVLTKLAKARLLITTKFTNYQNSNKTVTIIELAHDTIIHHWSQLLFWVESNREAIKQKPAIEADAQRWLNKDKSNKYLLTGRKLSAAESLLESDSDSSLVSVPAQEFLEKSIKSKHFQRNFRLSSIVGLILMLAGLSGFSLISWRVAEKEKLNAQLNALSLSSEHQFTTNQRFDALMTAIKAGIQLQHAPKVAADSRMRVLIALQQAVYGVNKRRTLAEHQQPVNSVNFSPDGELIASGSDDGTIKLWTSSGDEVSTLKGHGGAVYSVTFSPNGKILASASDDGTVKLWSRNGKQITTITGHQGPVNSVSFSPDGQAIASAGVDGTIKLWNLQGREIGSFKAHQDTIYSISYGKVLASASEDKTVKLWDNQGKLLATLKGYKDRVLSVSVSPDGETIASASWDNTVKVWGLDGEEIGTLSGHKSPVISVNFSRDGKTIASASTDGVIKLWSRYGREIATLKGHSTWVSSVSFSPDGLTIASASADNTIKLWSLLEQKLPTLKGHTSYITAISFSSDAKMIATGGYDQTVKIWSLDGEELATLKGHKRGISSLSFSPDSKTVASASADGTGIVWNLAGLGNATLSGHKDRVYSISYRPDGQMLATASGDKTIKLWNIRGQQLKTFPAGIYSPRSVVFSPDGEAIAAAGYGDENEVMLKVWNIEGEELGKVEGVCSAVKKISFSADGQIIAAACADNTVKFLTLKGQVIATLRGHQGEVNSLSLTADGQIIASGSDDGTVKIWTGDGEELVTLPAIREGVMDVSFSPDGKMLGAVGRDRVAMLWNFDLDDLLARGCDFVHDYLRNSPHVKESDRGLCEGV